MYVIFFRISSTYTAAIIPSQPSLSVTKILNSLSLFKGEPNTGNEEYRPSEQINGIIIGVECVYRYVYEKIGKSGSSNEQIIDEY